MDHFSRLKNQVKLLIFLLLALEGLVVVGSWWLGSQRYHIEPKLLAAYISALAVLTALVIASIMAKRLLEPVQMLWQAVMHVSSGQSNITAPNLKQIRLGRELVTSLCLQVYQLASSTGNALPAASKNTSRGILDSLPLPVFAMDENQVILVANDEACKYLGLDSKDVIQKDLYSVLDLSFSSNDTYDSWLSTVRGHAVTANKSWERVRIKRADQKTNLQFDMAAHYNGGEQSGTETIIVLFDHSASYQQDDDSLSFMALTVHELRTPLTLIRGYIESLEDTIGQQANPLVADTLHKLEAGAQQLTIVLNNVLNVAKVDANQLFLQLNEENWPDIVTNVVRDMTIRAEAQDVVIDTVIAVGIPTVAAERVSIYEVLANVLDNAIKYSPPGQKILVKVGLNHLGLVETTVQDFGPGIPVAVLPHLFEKFYRSHQTKGRVSGTGLGLYLCKAIMTAHDGNIWVQSKEGQGTIIGFSLLPYSKLAEERKNNDNKDIVRVANGWIKNHSLYRR